LLPGWFVEACAPERSPAESEKWLRWWRDLHLDEQTQIAREQQSTLGDWLYWMEPSERQWYWWDGAVENPERMSIVVQVESAPSALGAREWLLRASGAVEIRR
jgi:hypothetical protein